MHISAEMAQRQIVDEHQVDGIQSPLSPVTDEEGEETSYLGEKTLSIKKGTKLSEVVAETGLDLNLETKLEKKQGEGEREGLGYNLPG